MVKKQKSVVVSKRRQSFRTIVFHLNDTRISTRCVAASRVTHSGKLQIDYVYLLASRMRRGLITAKLLQWGLAQSLEPQNWLIRENLQLRKFPTKRESGCSLIPRSHPAGLRSCAQTLSVVQLLEVNIFGQCTLQVMLLAENVVACRYPSSCTIVSKKWMLSFSRGVRDHSRSRSRDRKGKGRRSRSYSRTSFRDRNRNRDRGTKRSSR